MTSAANQLTFGSKAGRISFADPKNEIEKEDIEIEFKKLNSTNVELKNELYYVEFKTVLEALSIVKKQIVIKGVTLKMKYAPLAPKPLSQVITIFIICSRIQAIFSPTF